jgi:hypothetical protein
MMRIAGRVLILGAFLAVQGFAQESALKTIQAELNDTYIQAVQTARLSRSSEEVESMMDSESKWRAYMNAECKAEKGGDACLVRMTKQRLSDLKALYLNKKPN